MKILFVADIENKSIWDHCDVDLYKDVDLIISCGDLKSEYLTFLATMFKAPVLYVHGNHDGNYDRKPPEGCHCIDGKVFEFNGIKIAGLGGSIRYNQGKHQYTEKQMESRFRKLRFKNWKHKKIDIFVSHAPLYGMSEVNDTCHTGFKCFYEIIDKLKPKYFMHGHVHLTYGRNISRFNEYKDTKIINTFDKYILEF